MKAYLEKEFLSLLVKERWKIMIVRFFPQCPQFYDNPGYSVRSAVESSLEQLEIEASPRFFDAAEFFIFMADFVFKLSYQLLIRLVLFKLTIVFLPELLEGSFDLIEPDCDPHYMVNLIELDVAGTAELAGIVGVIEVIEVILSASGGDFLFCLFWIFVLACELAQFAGQIKLLFI